MWSGGVDPNTVSSLELEPKAWSQARPNGLAIVL